MAQEISQDQLQFRVLEALFELANKSDGQTTDENLSAELNLPVLRVELALKSLNRMGFVSYKFDGFMYYSITELGYREVEQNRLAPGHTADVPIPASDRIVTLNDNRKRELESSVSVVIDEIHKANAIDGDELLRERFIAQLSAARELVRTQSIRAYLFYQLVVEVLSKLISTYGTTALGIAATKLLELYVEYLVKGD